MVTGEGIRPLDSKVQVVRQFPVPTSLRQLREFLGLINFYHRFVPQCAHILQPLHALLAGSKGPSQPLVWTDEAQIAFGKSKEMLANATLLTHPKPDAPTCIITDASDTAVGAVLQQCIADVWRKLKPAETRYSTFDRELLAIYLAIKHFQYFVEGREFHVLTDHKPLIYARDARPDRHSPRQIRHLDFIAQFTADIRHVKGTENSAADTLSRIAVSALHPRPAVVVDFRAMAEAQRDDPELRLHRANSSLDLQ